MKLNENDLRIYVNKGFCNHIDTFFTIKGEYKIKENLYSYIEITPHGNIYLISKVSLLDNNDDTDSILETYNSISSFKKSSYHTYLESLYKVCKERYDNLFKYISETKNYMGYRNGYVLDILNKEKIFFYELLCFDKSMNKEIYLRLVKDNKGMYYSASLTSKFIELGSLGSVFVSANDSSYLLDINDLSKLGKYSYLKKEFTKLVLISNIDENSKIDNNFEKLHCNAVVRLLPCGSKACNGEIRLKNKKNNKEISFYCYISKDLNIESFSKIKEEISKDTLLEITNKPLFNKPIEIYKLSKDELMWFIYLRNCLISDLKKYFNE